MEQQWETEGTSVNVISEKNMKKQTRKMFKVEKKGKDQRKMELSG